MSKPKSGTYPAYFDRYISLVDAESLDEAIDKYNNKIEDFFAGIPEEKSSFRYAEGKWSIKELLQHIIDTERIFAYRALCLSRGEITPLPGFDENTYADNSNADARNWHDLVEELKAVRHSTNLLLKSFNDEQLNRTGVTNEQPNTPLAISYTIFGHLLHHMNIVKERYL